MAKIYTTKEINDLVSEFQDTRNEEIIEKVLTSMTPLFLEIIKFHARSIEDHDDMLQDALIAVVPNFDKWDRNGGSKFTSFACQKVKWIMLSWYKFEKNNLLKNHNRLEAEENENDIFDSFVVEDKGKENTLDYTLLIEELFTALTEQDIYCVRGFYLEDKSEREIEREGRMTRYTLSNKKYYALKKMKKYADEKGISFEEIFCK